MNLPTLITELTTMVSMVPDAMDITAITFVNVHTVEDIIVHKELCVEGNIMYRKNVTKHE